MSVVTPGRAGVGQETDMTRSPSALRRTMTAGLAVSAATATAAAAIVIVNAGAAAPLPDAATFEVSKTIYKGLCDASAAVALSPTRFAVFNDEDNHLRFFTFDNGTPSAPDIDLDVFLETADDKEADVEGAARIGDLVYWISSHGRNSEGEFQKRRLRFFATRVTPAGPAPLQTEGKPYRDLLEKFIEPILNAEKEKFTAVPGGPLDPEKAPEAKDSLNIEGLAASGNSLLIGFRNPQPKVNGSARALVVELKNPAALITNAPAAPEKGEIFRLDLGGRGVRSLEALPDGRGFVIVAGPFNDIGTFALYRWDGTQANQPVLVPGVEFKGFTPEAMFVDQPAPGGAVSTALNLTVMSDDGSVLLEDGQECKKKPKTRWRTRLGKIKIN
jgi:hypothetical protein